MNKLYYVANVRMPTEKAHGIQIMKMCEAFSNVGLDVELVVPKRKTHLTQSAFEYYGVSDAFKLTRLWCLDTVKFGWLGFWVESMTFAERAAWYLWRKEGIFYTRDEFLAALLSLLGKQVVWEAHMGQKNLFTRFLVKRRVPIVAISGGLKDLYMGLGVQPERIIVAHDGVDLAQFGIPESRAEARETLGLPQDEKIALYTGSRYAWKGVDTLEEAQKLLSQVRVLVVSGKPYTEIPLYLRAADVLVLPNSATDEMSRAYTSPMKLFEYMASGTPIVASDVSSIREVLDERSACFFTPDDAESLAATIQRALAEPSEVLEKAREARKIVSLYTWNNRAKMIIDSVL